MAIRLMAIDAMLAGGVDDSNGSFDARASEVNEASM